MYKVSKLDELLRELCPDGVEYKKLGEIATISRGGNFQKKDFLTEGVPCIHYGQIYTKYGLFADKTFTFISEECAIKQKMAQPNDIVMAVTSENIEDVCKCLAWLGDEPVAVSGHSAIIHHNQNAKYLVYYFHSQMFFAQKRKLAHGTKVIEVTPDALANITLPVPPAEIQHEVVRVLDSYTENVAELQRQLTAELTARQKQYEFYRDKLLTFDVLRGGTINFCQRTLGELFDFRNGLSKGKEFFGKGTPFVRYTDVYNHRTLRKKDITALVECTEDEKERLKVSRGDVLFTRTSETAEDIGWSSVMLDDMDDCVFNGFTIKATPKTKELLPEYCAYCFSTSDFRQYVTKHCAFTTRASLTGNTIAQYRMTIPPLDIQSRIVNVLDNFEKICSDLKIGLPAEIEARQKQYEYYRDKLLTCAETGNTILSEQAAEQTAEQSRASKARASKQSRAEQSRALIKLLQYVFGYVRISLGDIGSICMCKRILKSQTNTVSGVPFYKIGTFGKEADAYISQETFNEYRSKYNFPKKGDVLISAAGTIGRTVVYDGKPAYFQDSNIVWIDNDESIVLNSYLRYCYELKPWKASEGGTIPRLYNDNIAKAVIAVPSIEEQKRVVPILDRFDAICNDLTGGLPAEIEARQKQYEYYRDKLLTFKEVAAT